MRINKYMHNIIVGINQRQSALSALSSGFVNRAVVFLSEFSVLGSLYSIATAIYSYSVLVISTDTGTDADAGRAPGHLCLPMSHHLAPELGCVPGYWV